MLTQAQVQRYSTESGLRDIMIADVSASVAFRAGHSRLGEGPTMLQHVYESAFKVNSFLYNLTTQVVIHIPRDSLHLVLLCWRTALLKSVYAQR